MKKPDLVLPAGGWKPRPSQRAAMNAWIRDKILLHDWLWHRRHGKDDCALRGISIKAHERIANYCHMLPQENQVREAIWEAVNPHTGILRLEEAFPTSIRAKTNQQQMRITLRNGSKVVFAGSDNYKSKIGSSLAGLVYSEWPLSDPASYAYLSPMLKENGGWCVRQGTPRGKNHGYKTYQSGLRDPTRFAQLLTIADTGADKVLDIVSIKQEYVDLYGEELGNALYLQEYYCSFDVAVFGSVFGSEFADLEKDGRFTVVPHNPKYKVFTAWDIGFKDSVVIFFYQIIDNKIHVIDYESNNLKNPDWFAGRCLGRKIQIDIINNEIKVTKGAFIPELKRRTEYDYETHWLPHDGKAKTFTAMGKSCQQHLWAVFGTGKVRIVPSLSKQDGYKAVRMMLRSTYFNKPLTEPAFEACKQYKYKYDDKLMTFSKEGVHDWTSHYTDALRMMAIAYKTTPKPEIPRVINPNHMDNGLAIAEM